MDHGNEIKEANKEIYIAPMYEYLLERNADIGMQVIPREDVYILGTPIEIEEFDKDFFESEY